MERIIGIRAVQSPIGQNDTHSPDIEWYFPTYPDLPTQIAAALRSDGSFHSTSQSPRDVLVGMEKTLKIGMIGKLLTLTNLMQNQIHYILNLIKVAVLMFVQGIYIHENYTTVHPKITMYPTPVAKSHLVGIQDKHQARRLPGARKMMC